MTDTIYNVTLESWLSSPRALRACLDEHAKTDGRPVEPSLIPAPGGDGEQREVSKDLFGKPINDPRASSQRSNRTTGYRATLRLDLDSRRDRLDRLRRALAPIQHRPDDKARRLLEILRARRDAGRLRAVIFVERHETARYLRRVLHDTMRTARVACTVARSGQLEPPSVRKDLRERFSPCSNGRPEEDRSFDILLCTDADGIGVNLEDADTVVNYDLTGGADRLVQRLGRIMRATPERGRTLYVYTFAPACLSQPDERGVYGFIRARYDRLLIRHERSSAITRSHILPVEGSAATVPLDGEVDVAEFLAARDPLTTGEQGSLAAHLAALEGHRERAATLPDAVHSVRHYSGAEPRLVVILRHGVRHASLIVEPLSGRVVSEEALQALNLLACTPDATRADVLDTPDVISAANEAIRQWCERHGTPTEEVERVAALYLLPASSDSP